MASRPLSKGALYTRCRLSGLPFRMTAAVKPLAGVLGQGQAVEALRFGARIKRDGYNLFVLGCEGPLLRGRSTDIVIGDLEIPALPVRPGIGDPETDQADIKE